MREMRLASPWVSLYHKVQAMFEGDPDVRVVYASGDGEDPLIKLYVEGVDKADALGKLMPKGFTFGAVTVTIEVIPSNEREETRADLFRKAFEGNPALSYVASVDGVMSNPVHYVVFRNKVVQFYNDDLGDVNGNKSTLYETIADELFGGDEGVFFCTDLPDNLGMPLVERQ